MCCRFEPVFEFMGAPEETKILRLRFRHPTNEMRVLGDPAFPAPAPSIANPTLDACPEARGNPAVLRTKFMVVNTEFSKQADSGSQESRATNQ